MNHIGCARPSLQSLDENIEPVVQHSSDETSRDTVPFTP